MTQNFKTQGIGLMTDQELENKLLHSASKTLVEEIIRRNYDWVTRFCLIEFKNSTNALDCVQEIMIQVVKSIHSFQGQSALKTWIFAIMKRVIIETKNKQRVRDNLIQLEENHIDTELQINLSQTNSIEKLLILKHDQLSLLETIQTLPDKQRQAIFLHYFEDLSVETAAQTMSCSVSTLKTHLFRGRKTLAKILGN